MECIPLTWVCDLDKDCADGSDERVNCSKGPYLTPPLLALPLFFYSTLTSDLLTAQTACAVDEFLCKDFGRCIPAHWKCDGDNDCRDSSDELQEECGEDIMWTT